MLFSPHSRRGILFRVSSSRVGVIMMHGRRCIDIHPDDTAAAPTKDIFTVLRQASAKVIISPGTKMSERMRNAYNFGSLLLFTTLYVV
jgi:hypothetical protein